MAGPDGAPAAARAVVTAPGPLPSGREVTGTRPGFWVPGIPLPPERRRAWRRYVALGDTLNHHAGDGPAAGAPERWPSLLAQRLRQEDPWVDHAHLAVPGHTVRHVLRRQLGAALDLQPDLVSVFTGSSDCLLSRVYRADQFVEDLDALVAPFVERGTTVVMSTLPDLSASGRVPPRHRGVVRRRLECANALLRTVARRHRVVLLDAWADPRTLRRSMWSSDRLHPSADGHRLTAASVTQLLGLPVDAAVIGYASTDPLAVRRRHSDGVTRPLGPGADAGGRSSG